MLNLFNRNNILLDEDIIEWIFNCYVWTFEQFDKNVFFEETTLVIPDNKHFPGKETSADGMANLIFDQVKQYAGMAHWPTRLFDQTVPNDQIPEQQPIQINGALRGKNAQASFIPDSMEQSEMPISTMPQPTPDNSISFTYHPQQLKSPEGIIAHFAHGLSYHLACTSKKPPPGGQEYLAMAGELTGIFMGFGLMFANSAVVQRNGGCGGCGGGQSPVRQVFLSDEEVTYALAIFCQLKDIDRKIASKHLKKHLRGFFKSAMKDCKQRMQHNPGLQLSLPASE